jgi:tRNA (guanosine-2'-O-)-methyltransferase
VKYKKEPTEARAARMQQVIGNRQPELTVVMENVNDPHNIAAMFRSCDAVGILEVYIINNDTKWNKVGRKSSASARKWLTIHNYDTVDECFAAIRKKYDQILASHVSNAATPLHSMELAGSCALVFGNEHDGVSQEAIDQSDAQFVIPQVGMIKSLNVSVACAVSLYEAFRQRSDKGMYANPQMSQQELDSLFEDWKYR